MLSAIKIVVDCGIIFGTIRNVNKIVRPFGCNKNVPEVLGSLAVGLGVGCWGASKFNTLVDAIGEGVDDIFNEINKDEEAEEKTEDEVIDTEEYVEVNGVKYYRGKEN